MEPIVRTFRVLEKNNGFERLLEVKPEDPDPNPRPYARYFRRIHLKSRKFHISRSYSVNEEKTDRSDKSKRNNDGTYSLDDSKSHIHSTDESIQRIHSEIDLNEVESFNTDLLNPDIKPKFTFAHPNPEDKESKTGANDTLKMEFVRDDNRPARRGHWRLEPGEFIDKLSLNICEPILEDEKHLRHFLYGTTTPTIGSRIFEEDSHLGSLFEDTYSRGDVYYQSGAAIIEVKASKEVIKQLAAAIEANMVSELHFTLEIHAFLIDNTFLLQGRIPAYLTNVRVVGHQHNTETSQLDSENADETEETINYKEIVAEISEEKDQLKARLVGILNELVDTKRSLKAINIAFWVSFVAWGILLFLYLLE